MREKEIDISDHSARPVTRELMEEADLIFALGRNHALILEEWMPDISSRVHLVHPDGIDDPIGMPVEHYRACAGRILEQIPSILEKIDSTSGRATRLSDPARPRDA